MLLNDGGGSPRRITSPSAEAARSGSIRRPEALSRPVGSRGSAQRTSVPARPEPAPPRVGDTANGPIPRRFLNANPEGRGNVRARAGNIPDNAFPMPERERNQSLDDLAWGSAQSLLPTPPDMYMPGLKRMVAPPRDMPYSNKLIEERGRILDAALKFFREMYFNV